MKSVSTMLIHEIHSLAYAADTVRVVLVSVTDDEIPEGFRLPPSACKLEMTVTGERAKFYREHLGEYVNMTVRKADL